MHIFKSEKEAINKGWIIASPFTEEKSKGRFKAIAEHKMGNCRKFFQKLFLNFVSFITCGRALRKESFKLWKKEVDTGKIISKIYCKTIEGTLPVDNSKKQPSTQPEIISDDWGRIIVKMNGDTRTFKDVIILPSEAKPMTQEWNWKWDKDDGMHHHPGIRIKDVEELILSKVPKPDVIILSLGRGYGGKRDNPGEGVLEVVPELKKYLEDQEIEVHILKTVKAIEKYNEIRVQGNKTIAALIHTTC